MFTDLFTINGRSREDATFTWDISLNLDSGIFKVHFPGNPILPGACQLEMFRQLAGESLGSDLTVSAVNNIKYLAIIDPRVTPSFTVTETFTKVDDHTDKCTVLIKNADTVFTKASLTFVG